MIIVFIIVGILLLGVGGGIYFTFGPGGKDVRDPIDEHAKMHELGIAHGHEGKKYFVTTKENHNPRHKH